MEDIYLSWLVAEEIKMDEMKEDLQHFKKHYKHYPSDVYDTTIYYKLDMIDLQKQYINHIKLIIKRDVK